MPKNPLSIWSEIIDVRTERSKNTNVLEDKDIDMIERIFRGETGGIHFHQLLGSKPPIYSAYVNEERRLLFIANKSTLALIDILPHHNYDDMKPGLAERFFRKTWGEMANSTIEYDVIACIPDFTPTPDYTYASPNPCVSYHQKFITLDDTQQGAMTLPTPAVIIGDPGCGKSSLCSVMMDNDLHNPALLDDGSLIMYFTESPGLAEKMDPAWTLDHPITARKPEANQLVFANYTKVLEAFGPPEIKGKLRIGEAEFMEWLNIRLQDKALLTKYPFIKEASFKEKIPTLYHEFQIITVCGTKERYIQPERRANLPTPMREFAYEEYQRYTNGLNVEGKAFDPNLLLWTPTHQPYSRVFHDEALSASPAISLMLHRLTQDANIIFFADPNQENARQMSDLDFIISELGVNGKPATKQTLGVTYRLPPTIASLANEVLTLKQNLNGGKNEKNQSDQVTCKPDEHTHPGSLSWVKLQEAADFVNHLNNSNEVYVVITHTEYKEEVKQLFGGRTSICTIEEARGQEFETAVLYRVTDPQRKESQHPKNKQKITLLQQVHKHLSTLGDDLKSKPHLAKSGRVNRRFESYMNSLYIAITRIVRQGVFIEAGDPSKNELHRRLHACITKNRHDIHLPKEPTLDLKAVLAKAEQDLLEGKLLQAKAGYLKAGKTEDEFEAAVEANHQTNEAIVKSMIDARSQAKTQTKSDELKIKPLSAQTIKDFDDIIKTNNKSKLIKTLKSLGDIASLLNVVNAAHTTRPTYLAHLLFHKRLRTVLIEHLSRNKDALLKIAKHLDWNAAVLQNDTKSDETTIPLILELTLSNEGLKFIDLLLNSKETDIFTGLKIETLMRSIQISSLQANGMKAKISLGTHTIEQVPKLFIKLIERNPQLVQGEMIDHWLKPLDPSELYANVNHVSVLTLHIIRSKAPIKDKLYQVFHSILEGITKSLSNEQKEDRLFKEKPISVFDLMLTDCIFTPTIALIIESHMRLMTPQFITGEINIKVADEKKDSIQMVTRIKQLMEVHNLSELGRALIDGMKSNPDFKESYSELSKKYSPSAEIRSESSLQTGSTEKSEDGETNVDMLNLFLNKAEVKKLGSVNHNPDGTTSNKFISLLQDERNQNAIIKMMAAPKTKVTEAAQENLVKLLSNIKLESMIKFRDNTKKLYEVPTWFYLLDHFPNFIAPYIQLMFNGLVSRHKLDLLTNPFHSVIFNCEINLVTYTLLVKPITLVNISKFSSLLFRHIQWDTCYKSDTTSYDSVILVIAGIKDLVEANQINTIIFKNSDAFLNSLSPERILNPPCEVITKKLTQLDEVLFHATNNGLTSLLIRKLSLDSKSRNFFDLASLSEPINFDALDEDEKPIVLTMTRLHLILLKEAPIGELTFTLKESQNLDLWIDLLVSNPVITKQTIIKYQWNALSSLISNMRLVEILSLLVSLNPERLRNLPDDIWHAPITHETAGNLPVKNYALMNLLIRTHGNDPIGEYFKSHYKDIHQLALNYNGFYYCSDDEISALNQVNLNDLNPSRLIESEDTDLLKSHLIDPNMHQHFRLVFKEYPIIDWIMKSQKLRDCLFNFFTEDHGISIKRLLSEFMQAIDINHVISVDPYKGLPLLHFIYTHRLGERLINDMLQFDARTFIQSLNFNTLTQGMAIKEDNKVKTNQPFLKIFIFSNHLRMLNFFRYSLITAQSLKHINMKSQNILFETKVFVNKITHDLLSTEVNNELAKHLIESLCLLFETMPSMVTCPEAQNMDIFSNAKLKSKVFSSSSKLIDSSARNRLLHALQPNANLLNRIMGEFKLAQPSFPEIMPMRQLQLHGLHEAQKNFYLGFLESDNQDLLVDLLATSEGPKVLPYPLSDGKPLILHLLEHKTLRSVTIKAIHDQLSNSTNTSYASLFTEKLLTSNITRDGHQIPLLFDLAQCSQGSELLNTIRANSANNFYSAFGCELFTMPFYSVDYQQMTTLCLVFSIKDIASLYEVLDTKEKLIKDVSSDFWTKTQSLGSSQVSIIGNLLNPTEANRLNASLCVTYLLLATENASDTTPNIIYPWFKKTLKTSNEEFGIFSLFDLLAYNEYNRGILTMFLIKHPIPLNHLLTEIVIPTGSILPLELIHRTPEAAEALRISYMDETIPLESRNDFINHASEMLLKTHDTMEPGIFSIFKHRLTYLTMQCSGSKTILSLLQILPELADRLNFTEPMTPEYKLMLDTFLVGILPSHTHAFKQLKPYLDRNKAFNAYLTHFEREINERSEALLQLTNDASTIEEDSDEALTRNALTWLYLLKLKPRCQFHDNPQKNEDFLNAAIRKKCFIYALSLFFSAYTKEERCISMSNLFKKLHLHQYMKTETNQRIPLISHLLNCYANSFLSADLPYALYKVEASPYYSPKADYTAWTTPAYSLTTEISASAPSHLDILLMETRLVDIANEFIKSHLAQFIGHYLTMDNLFTPFKTPDGDKVRAELLLQQAQFLNYFIIALRKAKNIPVISLANLLNGDCKNHSSEIVPDTHLVMQLFKTEHGHVLLKEFFKNKALMNLLDMRLRDIITTVAEPPQASVANHGFFAPGIPSISVTSADQLVNFIKNLPS